MAVKRTEDSSKPDGQLLHPAAPDELKFGVDGDGFYRELR
jgi:hypothetical protein